MQRLLVPQNRRDENFGKWYAVIWCTNQSQSLYIGKVKQWFLVAEEGPMDCITFSYLKTNVGSGNIIEANSERKKDIDNIDVADIIDGPLEVRATKKVTMVTGTCDQVQ